MTTTKKAPAAKKSPAPIAEAKAEVGLNVPLPVELHRKLRLKAVANGVHLKDAVVAAVEAYVA